MRGVVLPLLAAANASLRQTMAPAGKLLAKLLALGD